MFKIIQPNIVVYLSHKDHNHVKYNEDFIKVKKLFLNKKTSSKRITFLNE